MNDTTQLLVLGVYVIVMGTKYGCVAERPQLLGGGAAVPRHSALLCLAVLPEQQADLQRMNRRCDDR